MTWLRARLAQTPGSWLTVVLAVVFIPLVVIGSESDVAAGEATRGLDEVSLGLLGLAGLCLLVRKRFPGTVVVLVMVLTSVWYGLDHTSGLINLAALVAFYQLGLTGDRRRQIGVGALAISIPLMVDPLFVNGRLWDHFTDGAVPVDAVGWPVAAILLGELMCNRKLLLEEYAERARTAEAERDAEAERRVTQERLRIARDLHDVLAHTVSVMHVQAGVAADTIDRDTEQARASLDSIRAAGKQAMNEVRATVAVLRDTEPGAAIETQPAPGIDRIPELVETVRSSGLSVDLWMDLGETKEPNGTGEVRLDSLVELTAYRVVQEGLTNVTRHADASHVDVRLHQNRSDLVVEVDDDGTPANLTSALTGGFGMKGMRERVEPLGGTLSYGPKGDGGGWSVVATLPTRKARS